MPPKPLIASPDSTVMHIVVEVRNHEADCRQLREVAGKLRHVSLYGLRINEGLPWIMFARRTALNITYEAVPFRAQRTRQSPSRKHIGIVIIDALSRPGE